MDLEEEEEKVFFLLHDHVRPDPKNLFSLYRYMYRKLTLWGLAGLTIYKRQRINLFVSNQNYRVRRRPDQTRDLNRIRILPLFRGTTSVCRESFLFLSLPPSTTYNKTVNETITNKHKLNLNPWQLK